MTLALRHPPRRLRPAPPAPCPEWAETWRLVWVGEEPAESLPSGLRAALFRSLRADGWSVAQVGAWTRTTAYTVARVTGHPTLTDPLRPDQK